MKFKVNKAVFDPGISDSVLIPPDSIGQILDSGYKIQYDDLLYAKCPTEELAVVVCMALNGNKPALAHAQGEWLSQRTCPECYEDKEKCTC